MTSAPRCQVFMRNACQILLLVFYLFQVGNCHAARGQGELEPFLGGFQLEDHALVIFQCRCRAAGNEGCSCLPGNVGAFKVFCHNEMIYIPGRLYA